MWHRIAVAFATAVMTLVAPSAASADAPLREALPLPPDVTTQRCGFPVRVHTEGQMFRTTWFDANGDPVRATETYPGLKYVLTNLVTHKQLTIPINGPTFWEFAPDGSSTVTGSGPAGWFPHPVTREPGIFLIRGRISFNLDPMGKLSSFRLISGQIDNVCPQLA